MNKQGYKEDKWKKRDERAECSSNVVKILENMVE